MASGSEIEDRGVREPEDEVGYGSDACRWLKAQQSNADAKLRDNEANVNEKCSSPRHQ